MPNFVEHEGEIIPAYSGVNQPRYYDDGPAPVEDMPHTQHSEDTTQLELVSDVEAVPDTAELAPSSDLGQVVIASEVSKPKKLTSAQQNANADRYVREHDQRTSSQILRGQRL